MSNDKLRGDLYKEDMDRAQARLKLLHDEYTKFGTQVTRAHTLYQKARENYERTCFWGIQDLIAYTGDSKVVYDIRNTLFPDFGWLSFNSYRIDTQQFIPEFKINPEATAGHISHMAGLIDALFEHILPGTSEEYSNRFQFGKKCMLIATDDLNESGIVYALQHPDKTWEIGVLRYGRYATIKKLTDTKSLLEDMVQHGYTYSGIRITTNFGLGGLQEIKS